MEMKNSGELIRFST